MQVRIKKYLTGAAALLLLLGVGAASQHVHAAVNPNRYGIDVFPSRQNHNRFAYQFRRAGHNSRVYYAQRNSKLGRAIFAHGKLKLDYANYMLKHHPKWYRSLVNRLNQAAPRTRKVRQHRQVKRNVTKRLIRRGSLKIRRAQRSVKKRSRLLPSRFTRSNNQRALKRSGFMDLRPFGGNFIFNKYAPNDRRAVVPKKFNEVNWVKGVFGQPNPPTYTYVAKQHGWKLGK